jgi:hypothetical protein
METPTTEPQGEPVPPEEPTEPVPEPEEEEGTDDAA